MSEQIAIIRDDKIIKVMPKSEYDNEVILNHQFLNQQPIYVEPQTETQTQAVMVASSEPILSETLQTRMVEPFQKFALLLVFGLVVFVAVIFGYKKVTGRRPSREAMNFLQTIIVVMAFFAFIKLM
ncbi:hypothetical protein LP114_00520 [Moraxella bovis]|nr:hypothetical protein [Moraxella bovis]UYZ81084.1 hypothetical protein LP113_13965 [Moraxella bovis]UYZ89624.1 hypothetical protein LP114_00520 [Moraxella bovis]UYZ95282.1 hypothetical protein LP121_01560 [Moraxella bovis]UZA23980.1 hypothetical protein LP117_09360 [Moraxella bovis]UZA30235.1 hypothetical protein LP097_00775 [Moraxella bovis]